jgi:hypothetical protein
MLDPTLIAEGAMDEMCLACGWTPDGHHPDDWQAFVPWRVHLLCQDCLAAAHLLDIMEDNDHRVAENEEETEEDEEIIYVDEEGNIISVGGDVPFGYTDVTDEVIDLTSDTDGDGESVATA